MPDLNGVPTPAEHEQYARERVANASPMTVKYGQPEGAFAALLADLDILRERVAQLNENLDVLTVHTPEPRGGDMSAETRCTDCQIGLHGRCAGTECTCTVYDYGCGHTRDSSRLTHRHSWTMTSQKGRRCEWSCACTASRTTYDGNG